jgi:hypothetical protein
VTIASLPGCGSEDPVEDPLVDGAFRARIVNSLGRMTEVSGRAEFGDDADPPGGTGFGISLDGGQVLVVVRRLVPSPKDGEYLFSQPASESTFVALLMSGDAVEFEDRWRYASVEGHISIMTSGDPPVVHGSLVFRGTGRGPFGSSVQVDAEFRAEPSRRPPPFRGEPSRRPHLLLGDSPD